jgi:DNA-directed RNA polymerase specialized sigma24 family protein
METSSRDGGLDRRIMHNIHFQAQRMAYRRISPGMDMEDYEQDLVADLLHRRRAFDPAIASFRTFADRVVAHRVSTLAQPTLRTSAERRLISLDAVPDHAEENEEALVERLPDPVAPIEEQVAIGIDVRRFVAALPPPLQQTCAILLADSITNGAREAGINRSTVHERITTVRGHALALGLAAYLPRSPDRFCGPPVCGGEDPRSDRPTDTAMSSKPPRIHLLVTESELRAWLARAAPGDRLDYHRGVLAADRLVPGSRLPDGDCKQLNRIADMVFGLAAAGRIHLLQRRNGPGDYSYIMVAGSGVRTLAEPTHRRAGDRP